MIDVRIIDLLRMVYPEVPVIEVISGYSISMQMPNLFGTRSRNEKSENAAFNVFEKLPKILGTPTNKTMDYTTFSAKLAKILESQS